MHISQPYKKWCILLIISFTTLFTFHSKAQIFWSEGFQNGCANGCFATAYVGGPNGAWTQTSTGLNDPESNKWFVSGAECGNLPPACGSTCGATDPSLHIGADDGFAFDPGAAYDAGGFCGVLFCVTTNMRAESPTINCSGKTNINLYFNYIEGGDGATDDATVWYYDGATWSLLSNMPKTVLCGNGQGTWTAFSMLLPASANNNANVKIGFNWTNNDDGVGTDPSFAVDDIDLSVQNNNPLPLADFSSSDTVICSGACLNFTDLTQNLPTSWIWTFNGGTPNTSNAQNPTNICYNTPGTYTVSLIAINANGSDTITKTLFITVNPCIPPTANFAANDTIICEGSCIQFTDQSVGASSWSWTFTGGNPATSTNQNQSVCYATPGTYSVTLTATNNLGNNTKTRNGYITVNAFPTLSSTSADVTIDAGESTTLTTTGNGNGNYLWSPALGLSCTACQSPVASPTKTTTYTVTYSDANGCSVTDSVTVTVIEDANPYVVFIPSAFSPNGDGHNDILFVRGKGIKNFNVVVYDRNGEKVFETSDLTTGWDGTYKGKQLNTSVFVYYLTGEFLNNDKINQKGDITLTK